MRRTAKRYRVILDKSSFRAASLLSAGVFGLLFLIALSAEAFGGSSYHTERKFGGLDNEHVKGSQPNAVDAKALVRGMIAARHTVTSCNVSLDIRYQIPAERKNYVARNVSIIDESGKRMYFYYDSDFRPFEGFPFADAMAIFRDGRLHCRESKTRLVIRNESTRIDAPFFFPVHCLGLTSNIEFELDKRTLSIPEAMYAMDDPSTSFVLGPVQKDGGIDLQTIIVDRQKPEFQWRLKIDPATFRIYEVAADSAMFPDKSVGENFVTTIRSSYRGENDSPIPDRVEIREMDGDKVTTLVEIVADKLEIPYEATEADFAWTRFNLDINSVVIDNEAERLAGYWNGDDWSSQTPVTIGPMLQKAIDEKRSDEVASGYSWFTIGITLILGTGFLVLLFVYMQRRA